MKSALVLIAILSLAILSGCETTGPTEVAKLSEPAAADGHTPSTNENRAMGIFDFEVTTITGEELSLSEFEGKVLLFVNVASECGFTRQYTGLQALWETHQDQGLVVLGFPANNFGGQEPGTNEEIQAFCENQFGVTFPMFARISVKGEDQHPLYSYLTSQAGEEIDWNFNKILVDRNGKVITRFGSRVEPESDELVSAIQALL